MEIPLLTLLTPQGPWERLVLPQHWRWGWVVWWTEVNIGPMSEDSSIWGAETEAERKAIDAACDGDNAPVGELLQEYRARLQNMVRLRLAPQLMGRVGVSDVIQETYAEVSERLPKYLDNRGDPADPTKGRMPFFLWVRFLAGQQLMRAHRFHLGTAARAVGREATFGGVPGASSQHLAAALSDGGMSPSGVASSLESQEILAGALQDLSETDREILMLRHFEQLNNREIAMLLGLSEPGASLRHMRALKRLREVLQVKGLGFPGTEGMQ
ncbi:MAG: RNA polymerase sigma-70 factor (ECF subfamily) [Glaciecola sp.]|jgi:RNA polymerase sigma-70 factor (ECF subfamily)